MTPSETIPEPGGGLRSRKKRQRYTTISETAIALFLERGFEKVSVAEVAAAAEISKPTLFRYFATKEDLVLHRFADHEDEAARVVTGRPARRAALDALQRHFLDALERHDPVTGLCDAPEVLAFHQLLYSTPSLVARLHGYQNRSEEALAEALTAAHEGDRLEARLAAGQIVAVQRILAEENWRRVASGEGAEEVWPSAVAAANRAYGQLRSGLTRYS
ncbi:TetR family transcriptional regulator [Streptomyces sp. WAC 01529]|uniref:TetR/AcrR family transcriptional regulator n=1 Tax=Streptomyces sp. WAC 01529 TaxID=2203205 RepID=UPI000F719EC5|nr:TetR/AcrR family transcriptional regulator [Streptomyces sp. WAC 01529]AZM57737.1 TetR family transcriptional regulator [Streptomyces sp. WAC 01529]